MFNNKFPQLFLLVVEGILLSEVLCDSYMFVFVLFGSAGCLVGSKCEVGFS